MEKLPRDINALIAQGVPIEEIVSLCRSNRRLNETVCENQNFYRAIKKRDFGNWTFPILPHEIAPIETSTQNTEMLKGVPVYINYNWKRAIRKHVFDNRIRWTRFGRIPLRQFRLKPQMRNIIMPGSGNSFRLHNTDYIWYYFMWAPKYHKMVNYNFKFTDEEILEDLRSERVQLANSNMPFGLSRRRANLITFSMGFVYPALRMIGIKEHQDDLPVAILTEEDTNTREKMDEIKERFFYYNYYRHTGADARPFPKATLYDVFSSNKFSKWAALKPRIIEDKSLEYYRPASFAFLAALKSTDARERVDVFDSLLRKYDVMGQIDTMQRKIDSMESMSTDTYAVLSKKLLLIKELIKEHENAPTNELVPYSDSVWPDYFATRMREVAYFLAASLNSKWGVWRPPRIRPIPQGDAGDEQ